MLSLYPTVKEQPPAYSNKTISPNYNSPKSPLYDGSLPIASG